MTKLDGYIYLRWQLLSSWTLGVDFNNVCTHTKDDKHLLVPSLFGKWQKKSCEQKTYLAHRNTHFKTLNYVYKIEWRFT